MTEELREKRIQAARLYMRHDNDRELPVVEGCFDAACAYLKKAGIADPRDVPMPNGTEPDTSQYDLAVNSLTLYYFDHRDDVGAEAPFPVGLRAIINQLKFGGDRIEAPNG